MKKTKTLSDEAKDFVTKKNTPRAVTQGDRIALRFYIGSALGGLIARSPSVRREEIIREAYEYAIACLEHEKKFT